MPIINPKAHSSLLVARLSQCRSRRCPQPLFSRSSAMHCCSEIGWWTKQRRSVVPKQQVCHLGLFGYEPDVSGSTPVGISSAFLLGKKRLRRPLYLCFLGCRWKRYHIVTYIGKKGVGLYIYSTQASCQRNFGAFFLNRCRAMMGDRVVIET